RPARAGGRRERHRNGPAAKRGDAVGAAPGARVAARLPGRWWRSPGAGALPGTRARRGHPRRARGPASIELAPRALYARRRGDFARLPGRSAAALRHGVRRLPSPHLRSFLHRPFPPERPRWGALRAHAGERGACSALVRGPPARCRRGLRPRARALTRPRLTLARRISLLVLTEVRPWLGRPTSRRKSGACCARVRC